MVGSLEDGVQDSTDDCVRWQENPPKNRKESLLAFLRVPGTTQTGLGRSGRP